MISSAEADAAAGGGARDKKNTKKSSTKRQRRKEANPSNTWPQQPRIQSPAARAKAYLRVAGFASSKATTHIDPAIDLNSPEVRFGRLLGGTDQRKRHEAVAKLQGYLKARCDINNIEGGISELDLMKLWKGMWYTLYMADKVPVQDELSKRLTELIWCLAGTEEEDEYAAQAYMIMCGGEDDGLFLEEDNLEEDDDDDGDVIMEEIVNTLDNNDSSDESSEEKGDDEDVELEEEEMEEQDDSLVKHCRGAHLASLFVKTFFVTVRREWGNTDKHRVDKFYTLIRLMIQQVFKYMAIRHWNIGIIRLFNDVLFEEVLSQTPNGLRYHLVDIAMEEIVNANSKAPMPLTEATFLDCLEPYFAMAQSVQDGLVHGRIMENILSKFLNQYSVANELQEEHQDPLLVLDQVHVASVAQFIFELASDATTKDKYRKDLYGMHKTYMKRLKKVGRDVVLDMDEASDTWADEAMDDGAEEEIGSKTKNVECVETNGSVKGGEKNQSLEQVETPKKTEKKKKKKRKKKSLDNAAVDAVVVTSSVSKEPLVEEEHVNSVEKRKKKKKREKEKVLQEEVITISSSEQKKAAEAAAVAAKDDDHSTPLQGARKKRDKSGKKSKRAKDKNNDDSDTTGKRVSFGRTNRSKSYKASLKDLKTMEQPSTATRTPDRSILLKKRRSGEGEHAGVRVVQKKSRRNATDYF